MRVGWTPRKLQKRLKSPPPEVSPPSWNQVSQVGFLNVDRGLGHIFAKAASMFCFLNLWELFTTYDVKVHGPTSSLARRSRRRFCLWPGGCSCLQVNPCLVGLLMGKFDFLFSLRVLLVSQSVSWFISFSHQNWLEVLKRDTSARISTPEEGFFCD